MSTLTTPWKAKADDLRAKSYALVGVDRPVILSPNEKVLVTGATGFIGSHVVQTLIDLGFRDLVCFSRNPAKAEQAEAKWNWQGSGGQVKFVQGNLLSRTTCEEACKDVALVIHLAAGTGEKSYPDAYMNSVVTTRNLLDASVYCGHVKRFVLVSSFAVYTNRQESRLLDESCPLEERPQERGDAYCFAKVKQEQLLREYGAKFSIPYTIVRPGSVYGPGKSDITGRVGLGTFGLFLHLGGPNKVPFTYVENCARAIVLAGIVCGIEGEAFNVVDDDLPSSRQFLRLYKKNVRRFRSVYVPHAISRTICLLWGKYSRWSYGQLPPAFTLDRWDVEWRKTRYSNQKLKAMLGWSPVVSTADGMSRFFESCSQGRRNA